MNDVYLKALQAVMTDDSPARPTIKPLEELESDLAAVTRRLQRPVQGLNIAGKGCYTRSEFLTMTEGKTLKQIAEEGLARERQARKAADDLLREWVGYGFGVEGPPPPPDPNGEIKPCA